MQILAQDLPTSDTFQSFEAITAPLFAGQNITSLLNNTGTGVGIVSIIFFIAGALLLLYLIWGGLELMVSHGSPDSIASGKKRITNALTGMLIVFTAYWIVQIIALVLGLGTISDVFGS